ncbi:ASCH domain-containing protein [Roseateles sp. DC23W]|uniref:ASCH domain-containing protein n=1 Tax=Pelomonas dachongensis TaxID=3299029 RepID=A0ABW7EK43_9BURK
MATFLLNFKKQFAPAVESGTKLRTIRQHRKDGKRIQPGDTLKLYTGLRTRGVRLLRTTPALRVSSIRLLASSQQLIVDGQLLDIGEKQAFAKADGFATFADMLTFFHDQYQLETFEGFCVEWSAP